MAKITRSSLESHLRTPVTGVVLSCLFLVGTIVAGTRSLLAFVSLEGLAIVIGGVIVVAFLSFEAADVRTALNAIASTFRKKAAPPLDLRQDMAALVAWAGLAKEKGMRNLESSLGKKGIADPFIKYGLNMVVSGYAPEEIRAMMETAADACHERDSVPVDILQAMTSHAPAFGMVGTLVGMVIMLCNLNGDMTHVGSSLSVAFLSTLYGVVSARMVYMPSASKLRQSLADRRFRHQLITEGMVMLVGEKAPMYIQDRLNSFLRPEWHDYYDYFDVDTRHAASPARLKVVGA